MRPTRISWLGGEHEFALPIGNLRALQDACDAGPEEIFLRLIAGGWRVNDIVETIRQGLIGSGAMDTRTAGPFVANLMEQHPLLAFKDVARIILATALVGPEDDALGKPQGESPPENGASAGSTETVQ